MIYKFSVGKAILTALEVVYSKTIETATSVSISYDVTTTRAINPDGIAYDEYKDEEKITIELSYVDDIDPVLINGGRYDILLTTGAEGGGITYSLGNCRLIEYSVKTIQDNFVTITARFSKIGSASSSTGSIQKVKFAGTYIGDSAYATFSYQGNVINRIIPTALGSIFQTTGQTGGGLTTIKVKARVKKDDRLTLESYINSLFSSLSVVKGSLVVEYGTTSYTLTNCVFVNGSMQDINRTYGELEIEFQRSAY
jgi:hypothetical protein